MPVALAHRRQPFRPAVVIGEGFSALALGAVMEPLGLARQQFPELLGSIHLYGSESISQRSANGMRVETDAGVSVLLEAMRGPARPDAVLVLTGYPFPRRDRDWLLRLLRACRTHGIRCFLMGGGIGVLVGSGLLKGGAVTMHWKFVDSLIETHPELNPTTSLFVREGLFTTCAGGVPVIDMMIDFFESEFGGELVGSVKRHFNYLDPRRGDDRQSGTLADLAARQREPICGVMQRMISSVESPLSIQELADSVRLSTRQVERLFHRELGLSPRQAYLAIRLEKARSLIAGTSLPLLEVALACGFNSVATLSREYRRRYGASPTVSRRMSI